VSVGAEVESEGVGAGVWGELTLTAVLWEKERDTHCLSALLLLPGSHRLPAAALTPVPGTAAG
jgi:hypothetical protein